jgi:predicted amidohydrolase YtcJ
MHVQPADLPDLYRLQSLTLAGIPLAAGSDAPYASFDPWTAIRAAQSRRSRSGRIIGAQECIAAGAALALYLGTFEAPGGPWRRIARGCPADLCLLNTALADALAEPDAQKVATTIISGRIAWSG